MLIHCLVGHRTAMFQGDELGDHRVALPKMGAAFFRILRSVAHSVARI